MPHTKARLWGLPSLLKAELALVGHNLSDGPSPARAPVVAATKIAANARNARAAPAKALGLDVPALALAETPATPGASVYFINLKDGDAVTSPFKVQFGLSGMGVAPAGVEKPKTGHHLSSSTPHYLRKS